MAQQSNFHYRALRQGMRSTVQLVNSKDWPVDNIEIFSTFDRARSAALRQMRSGLLEMQQGVQQLQHLTEADLLPRSLGLHGVHSLDGLMKPCDHCHGAGKIRVLDWAGFEDWAIERGYDLTHQRAAAEDEFERFGCWEVQTCPQCAGIGKVLTPASLVEVQA